MGFFDYLLFSALINNIRNSGRCNEINSNDSNDGYNRGYEDGYDDSSMDHNDFNCQDDCDCGYDNDCFDF